jgi:hypothetical protein
MTRWRNTGHRLLKYLPMKCAIYLTYVAAILFTPPTASAEPNKEQYELQERCGKRTAEVLKSAGLADGITNTATGQEMTTFQNHYSATLNKCFCLQIVTTVNTTNKNISTSMTLFDVNENKDYGNFFKMTKEHERPVTIICDVKGQLCHSEIEWQELLKPFMEE